MGLWGCNDKAASTERENPLGVSANWPLCPFTLRVKGRREQAKNVAHGSCHSHFISAQNGHVQKKKKKKVASLCWSRSVRAGSRPLSVVVAHNRSSPGVNFHRVLSSAGVLQLLVEKQDMGKATRL